LVGWFGNGIEGELLLFTSLIDFGAANPDGGGPTSTQVKKRKNKHKNEYLVGPYLADPNYWPAPIWSRQKTLPGLPIFKNKVLLSFYG